MLQNFFICPDLDDCLRTLKEHNHLAVAVSRKHALNNPVIAQSDIYCFQEDQNINTFMISMHIKKDHPKLHAINELAQRAFESGLFVKWTKDSKVEFPRQIENTVLISLTIDLIYGAIFAYVMMMSLSIVILFAETLAYSKARMVNAKKYWIYMDIAVDAERHYLKNISRFFQSKNRKSFK